MDMMKMRFRMMMQSADGLPKEYRRVAYLESSGTQCIYTDIPARSGIECNAKVAWIRGGNTDATIFGGRKYASDRIMLVHQYPQQRWTLGYGPSNTGLSWIDYETVYRVSAKAVPGEQYLKINGETVYSGTVETQYSNDFNMSLFACTYNISSNFSLYASARIYELNATLDGNEVLNVIPCVRKSDGKPGMYDTVSKTFYTNTGTGEFIIPQ